MVRTASVLLLFWVGRVEAYGGGGNAPGSLLFTLTDGQVVTEAGVGLSSPAPPVNSQQEGPFNSYNIFRSPSNF